MDATAYCSAQGAGGGAGEQGAAGGAGGVGGMGATCDAVVLADLEVYANYTPSTLDVTCSPQVTLKP